LKEPGQVSSTSCTLLEAHDNLPHINIQNIFNAQHGHTS
jgi:hypothetical protein